MEDRQFPEMSPEEFINDLRNAGREHKQHLRVEALRAASRVMAMRSDLKNFETGESMGLGDAVVNTANQFLRWLETGER